MPTSADAIAGPFRAQHAAGRFPGGQLVVMHRGQVCAEVAVGLASGHREGEPRVEVTSDTLFPVFSVSKPFVAIAIAMLEERGGLDLRAPLSDFVPEWPADRTVLDVLSHRTGILLPELVTDASRWADRPGIVRAIAQTPPRYPRGTLAYAPYEFGWMLAEIFERAAKEPLPRFLERELLKPAGIDVRFTTDATNVARNYWLGPKHEVAGVELSAQWEAVHNDPATRATFVPGAGMVATAGALAKFYSLLLAGGQGLLKPETIRAYTTLTVAAWDRSNRLPLRVGRGFLLGAAFPSVYGWFGTSACFGHAGAFCAVAGADPNSGIALAWITNANRGPYDLLFRSAPLWSKARAALP